MKRYFLFTYLVLLAQTAWAINPKLLEDGWVLAFTASTLLGYTLIYLLPVLALYWPLHALGSYRPSRATTTALACFAVFLAGAAQALLFADLFIYRLYNFHINGFVLNLLTTPGGIDSLGAGASTQWTAAAMVAGFFVLQAGLYRLALGRPRETQRPRYRYLALGCLLAGVAGQIEYGISALEGYSPVLLASASVPGFYPMTFRKLAKRLGYRGQTEPAGLKVRMDSVQLNYPLEPLRIEKPERPLNIVWLVAESLRWDMLTPEIMPRLWQFSTTAHRFEQNYSGSNQTRMGVFSMFYGLYGSYWFSFLDARRQPVLMDVLQQQDYQFGLYTSQRFTYPEFDKTVFVNIPPEHLHERGQGEPWQRDEDNISDLLGFIERRDPARPFMTYMFFESTHANYSFPAQEAIRDDYVSDFNYLTTDLGGQIEQIKNRYINAAHHVDREIGRVLDHMRERGLLDQTIVVFLGDHGEEFMERGRWGHSSEFNQFQTRTPLVVHVPGTGASHYDGITSHLDLPATLLPHLGVKNPPADYSLGYDLLGDRQRSYAVAADWNRTAYLGDYKVAIPVATGPYVQTLVTTHDDRPVPDSRPVLENLRGDMAAVMKDLRKFSVLR